VLAAGRYLQAGKNEARLPPGLGARHRSAAAVTATIPGAIAVTVSQTTGTVRVFRDGEIVLELGQTARRI
jgi:DNA integrity scanning protein DisA with diadenylate cyclase activity